MIRLILIAWGLTHRHLRVVIILGLLVAASMAIALAIGKAYQNWDRDPDRGAIPITQGTFGEDYATPVYLDQGWTPANSLWFYNTTQGSNLVPYDIYMALEEAGSEQLFNRADTYDTFRYLPQKPTFFNPDGLPVGFVKDGYQGNHYIGFTCAACHTGQINFKGQAIRIDGAPAMADMVGFLSALQQAMEATLQDEAKLERFVARVVARKGDFRKADKAKTALQRWTETIALYNQVNQSTVDYGYARLDAFGRIYNRVLQHVINRGQLHSLLLRTTDAVGNRLLTPAQVDLVLTDIDDTIIGNKGFAQIYERLQSKAPGYPGLTGEALLRIRDSLFNEPNAPVSYPFLWDITHSDYVQWNGLGSNAGVGPLGRNAGEVIGVFGTLDWSAHQPRFSLSAKLSGQSNKRMQVNFKSSIDLVNLERIENHLRSLKSPVWPEDILGKIDQERASRGQLLYQEYCQSCHEVIDRSSWDRVVIAKMSGIGAVKTDPQMAENSVAYKGLSGNFKHTVQSQDIGKLYLEEEAPVAMILTSVTKGVVATPDPDKFWVRRWLDWLYLMAASFFDNTIEATVKAGNYTPDTTASPFNSLLAYKARSLNGIWSTAPYLHNGSVPSLYELLLPKKRTGDPDDGEYRPDTFMVGAREFDPEKVGFVSQDYDGFVFDTRIPGNLNSGHEYASGHTAQPNGQLLPALSKDERLDLLEYLKTL